ncbi:MAG: glycosyltransferase [Candidatus Gracilibacteria bacterium]|nr:glycosyltransferase [Candidatus Gracilibacteria bacterium]
MNFIFFGRLAKEKGFDLLVRSLENIVHKTGELPGNFFLFGEGDLQGDLFGKFSGTPFFEDCSRLSGEEILEKMELLGISEEGEDFKIYFFGWQSLSTIRGVLEVSHFSLMPSRFLETFGLAALESLSEGVPVIGFQKGGLIPFIPKDLAVPFSSDDGENIEALSSKIVEVAEKYSSLPALLGEEGSDWDTLSHESRRIADSYTEGRWMRQVREMLPAGTGKILLVSDYTTLLGGIETHVQTIARTLRKHGYEVEIFGWDLPKGKWTRILRLMGLPYSLCNITSTFGIRKKIQPPNPPSQGGNTPDVIWLHSVSRFLGPLVVREVNKSGIFSMVTYHDLGLISPFPSKVESEGMIPKTPSLRSFLDVIYSKNPILYIATCCKYFQVSILRKSLQKIHIHIVPSQFLVPYIRDIGEIPEEKITVLEHFL